MSAEPNFTIHPDTAAVRAAAEELFTQVASALRALLPASAEIRHIGATAIPGCLTKGDLDIVVRVEQQHFARADELLAQRFARNTGSVRTGAFSAFEDTEASPPLGIQLTAVDGPYDDFHLFVDALQRDPHLVERSTVSRADLTGSRGRTTGPQRMRLSPKRSHPLRMTAARASRVEALRFHARARAPR